MADRFASMRTMFDSPFREAFAITPNDSFSSAFTQPTRAIQVGSTGNIRCRFVSTYITSNGQLIASNTNNIVTLVNVPAGDHDYCIDMVLATGTTSNNIIGLF